MKKIIINESDKIKGKDKMDGEDLIKRKSSYKDILLGKDKRSDF